MAQRKPIRLRLASAILGSRAKEFIPPLPMFDGWGMDAGSRLKNYRTKNEQITANIGWVYSANTAIVDPCAAVELKLYRKKADGDKEEVTQGPAMELLELLDTPNLAHTGEQLRQLHFTYMNLVGEGYLLMLRHGEPFIPIQGQLPDALQVVPAHQVQFKLGSTYSKSTVKFGTDEYPLMSFVRDINPDPSNPYFGRSIISAAAATIDTENQMKDWNRRLFANNARPSLIFKTNESLSDEAYNRWKLQFSDDNTGAENAYKPLLIEGGDATPYMLNQQDLDFLDSRKFSRDEILAMFRVSPGVIGSVEDVNRSNLEAGFYIHALINVVPRVRQFVKQLNATLVHVYDPTLELDFESPVPEDVEAKLSAAQAGVDKWWTKDEVRDMYGEEPLPDGLGEHIVVIGKGASTLEAIVEGTAPEPAADNSDAAAPSGDDTTPSEAPAKSLAGVKKKT